VAVRHGSEPGQVTLGGRRVRVRRPRVRTTDGTGELPVPTYQAFTSTELLGQLALERMLAKLSTRRYPAGLEPVGTGVASTASGTSKSAISRRFIARTEHALAELLAQDLSTLDLVALLVDGIRVAEHCCVVALGITIDGTKIPLALGRGRHREHHRGHRRAGWAAGAWAGGDPADPGGARRRQGAAPRRHRGVRPPGHPTLSAPQAPQRQRPAA
jgi:hypothetical protein